MVAGQHSKYIQGTQTKSKSLAVAHKDTPPSIIFYFVPEQPLRYKSFM